MKLYCLFHLFKVNRLIQVDENKYAYITCELLLITFILLYKSYRVQKFVEKMCKIPIYF